MNQDTWTNVDSYYNSLLVRPAPEFEQANQSALEGGLPGIQITAPQGKLLETLVRFGRVKRILEIGTLGGYSTAWLARGLNADGVLISLEIDPVHAEIARKNLSRFDLDADVEILVGDGRSSLQLLIDRGEAVFDLIFIDAAKHQYRTYLELALKLSRPGTLIIADNVVRRGNILNLDSKDPSVQGIRDFNEYIAGEPRLSATVIQTVGEKGYDGFAFLLVTSPED